MGKQRAREAWWAVGPWAAGVPSAQVMTYNLVVPQRSASGHPAQNSPNLWLRTGLLCSGTDNALTSSVKPHLYHFPTTNA